MLAVVEPMVSVHTTRELRKFSQTSQPLQVISRPATWAHSHLAHRPRPGKLLFKSKSCITIQSRLCGSRERCTIISGEFLNAFACKLVLYMKRFHGRSKSSSSYGIGLPGDLY